MQKYLSRFFFDHAGAKKKLAKRKRRLRGFALCGARQGLLALDLANF